MRSSKILAATFIVGVTAFASMRDEPVADAGSTSLVFGSGSLIIPTNASFQDDCGAVSAYGLIYDVLRAEPWLGSNGHPVIDVYYIINDTKKSPNRCRPTQVSTGMGSSSGSSAWIDGCDFDITGSGQLVKAVNLNSFSPANDTTITTQKTTGNAKINPGWTNEAIGSGTSQINYGGGPFVIDSSQAAEFLQLIAGSTNSGFDAFDTNGNKIDFSAFRSGTCSGINTAHKVNIHRTYVSFTAPYREIFTAKPPRLALLENDSSSLTGKLVNGILEGYLSSAGLNFSGAHGTPSGTAGQIYDTFDFKDLVTGQLTKTDLGVPRYAMLWTPHWELKSSAVNTSEGSAMANIASFLNGQTGLMGECASISTYEGDTANHSNDQKDANQFQTCKGSASCTGAQTYAIEREPAGMPDSKTLGNCDDLNASTTGNCVVYPTPSDAFIQTAEYSWFTDTGHVVGFTLNSGTTFQPGVVPLLEAYSKPVAHGGTLLGYAASRNIKDNTPGKANILYLGGHDQTANVAGTKVALQTLLLLGVSSLPPDETTTETSRSTPIAVTLPDPTKDVIVTGTFENVQPTITPPPVVNPSDLSQLKFPWIKGHLRATDASSILVGGIAQGSGTVEFDAATKIPTPALGGCSPAYQGTCRTVFTAMGSADATGLTFNPTIVPIDEAHASTVAPLMTVGSSLGSANYSALMDRVVDGYWNGSAFEPVLGGIDRSTVALVEASDQVNGTRPMVAYVGADDGMLHAFCVDSSAKGCPTALGTELWAFMPREVLPAFRFNTAAINGSPRVTDMFGDFYNTGTKSWRTILTFMTGSGDPTTAAAAQPALYELDISDPFAPKVVFAYTIPNPSARVATSFGLGLAVGAGPITLAGQPRNLIVAETTNGGTAGDSDSTNGIVVTGLDAETGKSMWANPFVYTYPNPTRSGGSFVPHTGIPGGAVGVDEQGQGYLTDIVFGDLYGDLWDLDATTGTSKQGLGVPLFTMSSDFEPIGVLPTIYSNNNKSYAVVITGGYVDFADAVLWSSGHTQQVLAINLQPAATETVPLKDTSAIGDIPFKFNLGTGDAGFSQVQIIGGELFATADSTDVNSSAYGTGGQTGHLYTTDMSSSATVVAIQGGAGSVANNKTGSAPSTVYAASSSKQEQISSAADGSSGQSVDTMNTPQLLRTLWLRLE